MTYTEFQKLKINTSAIGWEPPSKSETTYFCTPKGAKIIGRAGVDGIHYCTIRALGETVFAVNPMNPPGCYVHPIARNIHDLLQLLLACLRMDIIEQAWMWDEEHLAEQIEAVRHSNTFDSTPLDVIREKCGLEAIKRPYEYLYRLQQSYNYAQIPFKGEYYETITTYREWEPPTWKVTMENSFTPIRGKGGKEISIGKSFQWGKETWHIPAVYLCTGGIVVDFFAELDDIDEDRRTIPFRPSIIVNGTTLRNNSGCGEVWLPSKEKSNEEQSPLAKWLLTHYGFDLSRAWVIRRCTFLSTVTMKEIPSLCLNMVRERSQFPGIRISAPRVGDIYTFTHPMTQTIHTLRVVEYEPYETGYHSDEEWLYPTHGMLIRCTVSPNIPPEDLRICDLIGSEAPRRNPSFNGMRNDDFCSIIGVIGSNDGPTTVGIGSPQTEGVHSACSGLHFDTPKHVDWYVQFCIKTVKDLQIVLI